MPLWNRDHVDALKASALVREGFVVIETTHGPANAAQAARELGFGSFSHLKRGFAVYAV